MEKNIDEANQAWKKATDADVIKAATKNLGEYSHYAQAIIETEARYRGLWEKVLALRGEKTSEPISQKGNIEGYVCEGCKGTYLNFETGRCAKCDLPSDYIGYCIECDKFWLLAPGQLCPEHSIKLGKHKAAMSLLRIGNLLFDTVIFRLFAYATVFIFAILLVYSGLVKPSSFENIDPFTDWFFGISLCYFYDFIFEAMWQRSPAKFITGTKVVTSTGAKPSVGTIAKRALVRFVPFDGLSFLGERVRGWHDRWSGTYVIKAKRFEKKKPVEERQIIDQPQTLSFQEPCSNSANNVASHKNIENCKNCERSIGRLEQVCVFNEHVVCKECYERLRKQV